MPVCRRGWSSRVVWLVAAFCLVSLAAGCDSLPGWFPVPATPTPQGTPEVTPPPLTTPDVTPTATVVVPRELVLWLPPEFDPQAETPAARLLQQRLEQFEKEQGYAIKVRLKAIGGPSSLLESMAAASAAAPMALPSVVALPRTDMETAALKGMLIPLDGLSALIDDPDWYEYARELALVQGEAFGLPFAGDAQVLVYRPSKITGSPARWEDLLALQLPVAFPAGSPLGLTTMALYRSVGGNLEDAQRRPLLEPEKLVQVYNLYRNGSDAGVFPDWITQYETDAQVWQAYEDGQVDVCQTWSNTFLEARRPDSFLVPLPGLGSQPVVLASGWAWAVADPIADRRAVSARLVEWLSDAEFLAEWTEALGMLPTRPASLAAWKDQSLKTVLGQVALLARARPSVELATSLGPVLRDSTISVIKKEAEPSQAAAEAAERITGPQTR